MMQHVLDLSESPAYLHVRNEQLVVDREGMASVSIPLAEIAIIILANPQITCTLAVLSGLMEKGGMMVACDSRNLPVGLMSPLVSHSTHAERLASQAAAGQALRKNLWKQIVRAKLNMQGDLLESLRGHDGGLRTLARTVRSGDPDNVEAQAARRYWPLLFDDAAFRRRRDADDQNRLLNYGYAVLRAVVARAVCGAGLHPSLGLHHHNRYDAFCLADDLMEPYRPVVDAAVVAYTGGGNAFAPLDRAAKTALLEGVGARYVVEGEARTLFDLAARTASSVAKALLGGERRIFFPQELRCA